MAAERGIDTLLNEQRDISADLVSALAAGSAALEGASSSVVAAPNGTNDGRISESMEMYKAHNTSVPAQTARPEVWSNTLNLNKE